MGVQKGWLILAALVMLAACGGEKSASKPPVAVDVQTAAVSEITEQIEVTGSLEPKFSVDVKSQISGQVRRVYVHEWVRVRKGQPLALIDVAETEAQVKRAQAGLESARASHAQAQVALNRADREQTRMAKLKEAGLATQQAMDDARTEVEAARARVGAAAAQIGVASEELRQSRLRLAKGAVNAPMAGTVAMRDVNVGDLVSDAAAGKPIFRIVDNRLLNLTFAVSSVDSARIKPGQALEFSVDSMPGKLFSGRVMHVNPELSASDRSMKVIAEVPNVPEVLKGGLFAKGRIIIGKRANILQVPRNAINGFDLTARKGILFVVENGLARSREVTSGSVTNELVEIVSGLKAGEQYVVRGGFNLKDGDRVELPKAAAK